MKAWRNSVLLLAVAVGSVRAQSPAGIGLSPRAVIPTITGIVNAATGEPNITSGGWASLYGSGFIWSSSGFTRPWLPTDFVNGSLPLQLNDISVRFNGVPAYVAYISPNQINVLIPDDPTIGVVALQEQGQLDQSNIIMVNKVALSPGLFSFAPGYPAAVHLDGTYCGRPNILADAATLPARPGEVIELYGTGFGPSNPRTDFSKLFSKSERIAQAVTATLGGVAAEVNGYLVAPGVYQFNLTVPPIADGDAAIVLTIAGQSTQTGMYLSVVH